MRRRSVDRVVSPVAYRLPAAHRLDGDVLDFGGGAEILAIPGHTEGSIAIHLPRDGVPVLDVETACFGHGEPIASGADDRHREVAATLVP